MYHDSLYQIVLEAIRNNDLSYRIPEERAVFPGEKAAIVTINRMMEIMQEQRQSIEMASWEKLTRILTHEIMNSLAPIVSLSDTFMEDDTIVGSELYEGIKAIHDTSEGLISFVDGYRKFSSLQKPNFENVRIKDILSAVAGIGIVPDDVVLDIKICPDTLEIFADSNLIRQVIVNIVKNAIEAKAKHIFINAFRYGVSGTRINISNDGKIIPEDIKKEMFVPFFTTKKTGNGIGLSLCRQILVMNKGIIAILPSGSCGWNTTFQIDFI